MSKGYYILDENKYKQAILDNMPDFMQQEFVNFVDGAIETIKSYTRNTPI